MTIKVKGVVTSTRKVHVVILKRTLRTFGLLDCYGQLLMDVFVFLTF